MIQDIAPHKLDNAFRPCAPRKEDRILLFDANGKLLARLHEHRIQFARFEDVPLPDALYQFTLDETRFFLVQDHAEIILLEFGFYSLRELREAAGFSKELFAAFTAWHLWRWYADNRYCGRCAGSNVPHASERALQCSACGHIIYPRINPAVIVGVIRGDCLLITRYRNGYNHNALVAGFTEIGETLEQTVSREVMEETGIRVKNIRYYKSQPWGIAQDLLAGFYCEADGDAEIRMDENELKYAKWVPREEIVLQPDQLSLTNEMMMHFKHLI